MLQRRRSLTLLSAAVYVATVTVFTAFHTHRADTPRRSGPCCSRHPLPSDPHGTLHFSGGAAHGARAVPPTTGHFLDGPGRCPICDFLAQKPMPRQTVAYVDCSPLYETPTATLRPILAVRTCRAWQSRAPPVA